LRCRVSKIGRHGEDRARPGAHAVDGGHDLLRALAHRLDEVPGHSGKGEEIVHLHARQRLDDLEHVASRAKISARSDQNDRPDIGGVDKVAEQVAEFGVGL
jgi:hypothetical protein